MFIYTAKLPLRKLKLGAALALLACVTLLLPSLSFFSPPAQETGGTALPSPRGRRTNEDRLEYLSAYGWELAPDPISIQELIIPKEMDESYGQYLTLQTGQGFDLTKYGGKRIKRYTYQVLNHPSGESGVQANLLLHRSTVIGGEVLSPQVNGFLHGLAMP